MFKKLVGFNVVVEKEILEETVERWAGIAGVEPKWQESSDFAVPGVVGARLDIGDSYVFVLAGENEEAPIAKFVKNKGQGLFLVSFEVEDLDEAVKDAAEKGAKFASEKPFDLRALGERLEKVFPTMVRTYEDKGFIWVMEKIKVTEKGVTEGTGPAAERVQRVFTQFLSDMKT